VGQERTFFSHPHSEPTQERLETALEEAAKNSVSYTDFLDEILSQEVASKQVSMGTKKCTNYRKVKVYHLPH
jgi:hypothetical protein